MTDRVCVRACVRVRRARVCACARERNASTWIIGINEEQF
jgi:hypothetical protein